MKITKEIMTKNVETIAASQSMADAYRLMKEKGIRHLPVVDERNCVVGILSDRDVQRAMDVNKVNAFQQQVTIKDSKKVEDFMNWPLSVVSETTSVYRVAQEMLAQKISAFIVQDGNGHMKGIVTTDDLLRLFLENTKDSVDVPLKSIVHYFTAPEVL